MRSVQFCHGLFIASLVHPVPWDPMGRLASPGTGGTSHGIPGYHGTLGWDRQGQSIMYPRPLESMAMELKALRDVPLVLQVNKMGTYALFGLMAK